MQMKLSARISKMVNTDKGFLTLVQTPAPDPYSQPSTYKLSSPNQLGQIGDELQILCNIKSWVKLKPYTEKGTGIQKEFWEQNTIFEVVSSEPVKSPVKVAS